jgi:hypothetical protein
MRALYFKTENQFLEESDDEEEAFSRMNLSTSSTNVSTCNCSVTFSSPKTPRNFNADSQKLSEEEHSGDEENVKIKSYTAYVQTFRIET